MRKAKAKEVELPGVNMTAMIDVVFVLIIFFIVTVKLEEQTINHKIEMIYAPHSTVPKGKDVRQITIDVDEKGRISIADGVLTPELLKDVLNNAVHNGGADTPIVILGDSRVQHKYIRKVMDAASSVGIWKIKFMVLKERGEAKPFTIEQITRMARGE